MKPSALKLHDDGHSALTLTHTRDSGDDAVLFRYVYAPGTHRTESPRPYVHPLYTLGGEQLTNFRPNDHHWHHGLSLTLTSVRCGNDDPVNFWGGPSHAARDGYQWRSDHGALIHRGWLHCTPENLAHTLDWVDPKNERVLLRETRTLRPELIASGGGIEFPAGWSLRWTSVLKNVSNSTLTLGNYHSLNGLAGSHYTGLQFRGARDLLDDHGDTAINIHAEGGLTGEKAVHGASAQWMEWRTQHDGTNHRTRILFENLTGAIPWFVRRREPLAAFSFHREKNITLAANAELLLDHRISFF